jgi:hypothetical protein
MKSKILILTLSLAILSVWCSAQRTSVPDSIYPPETIVIPGLSDWTKTHYPQRIKEFKTYPLDYNDIVFIGNSIVEMGCDWGGRFNSTIIKNRGIAGDNTAGVLQRLGEIRYFKPSAVFILIGVNDLFVDTVTSQYVANNIFKIVKNISHNSPSTKIYVQTILPTNMAYMVSKIKTTNDILRSNPKALNYTLVDLHSLLADNQDLIVSSYTKDGVHLTEAGYSVWENAEKKYFIPNQNPNLLKNADLNLNSLYWTSSGTPNMFKVYTYSPREGTIMAWANNYWAWTSKINGSITQTVTGLKDTVYIFSCQFSGATPGPQAYSALIATDGKGKTTKKEFSMPPDFIKIEMPVTVTGGSCTVGFTIKDTTNSTFWFSASDFKFYKATPKNGILDQIIDFPPIPVKVLGDPDFVPTTVNSSGLPVSFTSSDETVARIVNGEIHLVAAGIAQITASNPGDNYHAPTHASQQLLVNFGTAPGLMVTPNSLTIAETANSTNTFEIISNTSWTASSNQSWLKLSSASGSGISSITLTAAVNPSAITRSATVTVKGNGLSAQTITVTQDAAAPVVTVSSKALSIGSAANSTKKFNITSNTSWTVTSDQNWLTIDKPTGSNNSTITLTAAKNSVTVSRSAIITVSATGVASQKITITQDPGTTGFDENEETRISIFPNPANTILFIHGSTANTTAYIYNTGNKLLESKQIVDSKIDISNLKNGIYILKMVTKKGIIIRKFEKK